jgi:hypothetical protein
MQSPKLVSEMKTGHRRTPRRWLSFALLVVTVLGFVLSAYHALVAR